MTQTIRIGTRGSKLALWQASYVVGLLREAAPDLSVEVEIIKTKGDKILDVALSKIGDKGLFTKELEVALLAGRVDVCVHSCKDMPTQLPDGLALAGFPARAAANDCIVATEKGLTLDSIPHGARVATGSLRRRAQLLHLRPDLEVCDIRGNVDTRVSKVLDGEFDCAVLAEAGMRRLGLDEHISAPVPTEVLIPAVGQGSVALEIRANDGRMQELCARITSEETQFAVEAERYVLAALEGGCQVPMGAHLRRENGTVVLDAFVASLDGTQFVRSTVSDAADAGKSAVELGQLVVDDLLAQGAGEILRELRVAEEA